VRDAEVIVEARAERGKATRRERFRAFMSSVDPAANPLSAIERGFYVQPPGAIANQIVGRFEIEPASRQLVVGGVGSGKTTQLLVCTARLNEIPDIAATYVDVSERQDLGSVRPGCLAALAACGMVDNIESVDKRLKDTVTAWAHGYLDDGTPDNWDDSEWVPGVVSRPKPEWPSIEQLRVDALKGVVEALVATGKQPVFLFDSMDRMTDHKAFSRVIEEDIPVLHACGVGVVLVGPLRSLAVFGRADADRFDHLHLEGPIDVKSDVPGRQYLESVLARRASDEILPGEVRSELALWSGGVLRDLMSLAKLAGEEAYLDGAESIASQHAMTAADRFGRSLLIGLEPDDLAKLKQAQSSGRFVPVSPSDVALLATRRLLQYDGRDRLYTVHPCIAPLLADVGDGP
jgi:hypothetical protein